MTPLLDAEDLALSGRLEATSLRMERPELVCLVGPNGSGKTSLLHALAGIGSPAGDVRMDGISPSRLTPDQRLRLYAYLPATREVAWPISGRDLIALGLPSGEAEAVEHALDVLELTSLADRRVDGLSTGERSRILIARALAPKPKLLLLDEPVSNLDPLWQIRLMEHLRALVERKGRGVLVALHDLDLAARYADRLIVMNGGRIAADGSASDIFASSHISAVFGVERDAGGMWRPVSRREDRRSSP